MKYVDMHCDTVAEMYYRKRDSLPYSLYENELQIDLKKLIKGDCFLQCFACFTHLGYIKEPFDYVNKLIDVFYEEIPKYSDLIVPVYSYADIKKAEESGLMAALLTIEEGEACEGSVEKLRHLYSRGARLMNITWNFKNSIGHPNMNENHEFFPNNEQGLTEKGFEIVEEMQKLGMVVDVSHLSDKGFYDVASVLDGPFVASHSDAREICPHVRNLTDDMIRTLASHGGVMGLNYCDSFIRQGKRGFELDDLCDHAMHIIKVGGIDVLGIGTDFDGIGREDLGISDASEQQLLVGALEKRGLNTSEIEKIFKNNVLRVFKEVLK